jgi:hypothetical protein
MIGSNNSTGLPEGSSSRICLPPTPTTISFRNETPCFAKLVDGGGQIGGVDCEAAPSSRLGLGAIGHRLAASACGVRRAQDQAKVAASMANAGVGCISSFKTELLGIERDRFIDIVDYVPNLNCRQ